MITYADVQRVYRSEKMSPALEKIDDEFYGGISGLMAEIGEEHRDYIKKLSDEIFEKRRNKIVVNALRSPQKEPVNLIPVERAFYAELTRALAKYRGKVFSGKFAGGGDGGNVGEQSGEGEMPETKKTRVRFLSPLPSIIGSDMVHYGPFESDDEVELPADNAGVLIDQEIAEEV
jgi:DNA replication initiation complex subunit (GINS family)